MFEWLASPEAWIALLTLTAMEIVLGIDNIIFISVLVSRLPEHQRQSARIIGLSLAMGTRILLLLSLTWILRLTTPFFEIFDIPITGRDLILIFGGLFLLMKSTVEIHHNVEDNGDTYEGNNLIKASFMAIIIQIAILDLVFSFDSVITAIGMSNHVEVMVLAIMIAVGVMMFSAKAIGDFIDNHPSFKILALSFLILIGVSLIAEAFDFSIPKGYIYFAMGFSACVEMINVKIRKHSSQKSKAAKE